MPGASPNRCSLVPGGAASLHCRGAARQPSPLGCGSAPLSLCVLPRPQSSPLVPRQAGRRVGATARPRPRRARQTTARRPPDPARAPSGAARLGAAQRPVGRRSPGRSPRGSRGAHPGAAPQAGPALRPGVPVRSPTSPWLPPFLHIRLSSIPLSCSAGAPGPKEKDQGQEGQSPKKVSLEPQHPILWISPRTSSPLVSHLERAPGWGIPRPPPHGLGAALEGCST